MTVEEKLEIAMEALQSIAWFDERNHYDSSQAFQMSETAKDALKEIEQGLK